MSMNTTASNLLISDTNPWMISDSSRQLVVIFLLCIFGTAINLAGIIGNILNICVFVKMGIHDSTNISLLGLAVSDLGCLLTLLISFICFNPLLQSADVPFNAFEIENVFGGWPHVGFTRITGLITAFATFERCVCVVLPLRVKSIITPGRTAVVVTVIFILSLTSISPAFVVNQLAWKFSASRNKTVLGIVHTADQAEVESIVLPLTNCYGYVAFVLVVIFTAVLVTSLAAKTKWRGEATRVNKNARDARVGKMMVMVSGMFIVGALPVTLVYVAMVTVPGFQKGGVYENLCIVTVSAAVVFEMVTSCLNMIIYMRMSSRFRAAFVVMFGGRMCFGESK